MQYLIFQVENITKTGLEQMGARPKFWFTNENGEDFLFKENRPGSGEDWAEKISCEICKLLDLPHAKYELASYQGKRGVITPNFVPKTGRLVLANELLARVIEGYSGSSKFNQTQHTVGRALSLIRSIELKAPPQHKVSEILKNGIDIFPGYLLLDTLIANQDRHHENWGLVADAIQGIYLAPTFDHGSSLARNIADKERIERMTTRDRNRTIGIFCERAVSAFYETESKRKPLRTLEAFKIASKRSPQAASEWVRRVSLLEDKELKQIVQKIPDAVMNEIQKEFTVMILLTNKKRISELA